MRFNGMGLALVVLAAGCGVEDSQETKPALEVSSEGMSTLADAYKYKDVCPSPNGGHSVVDSWRFYECECTSYAAFKLNKGGTPFNDSYKGVRWGDALNWKNAAQSAKIRVSMTAHAGDIAWFSSGRGHVAYVESVNSDGSVNISEYNWTHKHDYGTRPNVRANGYIHF